MWIDYDKRLVKEVYVINRGDPVALWPKPSQFVILITESLDHFNSKDPEYNIMDDVIDEYEDSISKTNGMSDHRTLFEKALNKLCNNSIYTWRWISREPRSVFLE